MTTTADLPTWAGARYRESAAGSVAAVTRAGLAAGLCEGPLELSLDVLVTPLCEVLAAPPYAVVVEGGAVTQGGASWPIAGGRGALFVPIAASEPGGPGRATQITATLACGWTLAAERRWIRAPGLHLAVVDDLPLQVELADREGATLAHGTLAVGVFHFMKELSAIRAAAPRGEPEPPASLDRAVRRAMLALYNSALGEVFPALPRIFSSDEHLTPAQWRLLAAVARAALPDPLPVGGPSLDETVARMEQLVRDGSGPMLEELRRALDLVGGLVPRGLPIDRWLRSFGEAAARGTSAAEWGAWSSMQHMALFPYYTHPAAYRMLGYDKPAPPGASGRTLAVHTMPPERMWDVVIVGSGPAGSVIADRLARAGRSVLLLEAGPYIPEPSLPNDELFSMSRLYKDSGTQTANGSGPLLDDAGQISVFQGRCVGGGGTINNAICFALPPHTLKRWHDLGFPVSEPVLRAAYAAVGVELGVVPLSEALAPGARVNPAWQWLTARFGQPRILRPDEVPVPGFYECMVNAASCQGCGWCGQGCAFARKKNALQVFLPRALANGAVLVPEAKAVSISVRANGKVDGLEIEVAGRGRLRVEARNVVLAASAIGTTELLLSSASLAERCAKQRLPIGEAFALNAGCVCHAFMRHPVHDGGSFQVAFYVLPPDPDAGFVVETWWNPPGMQAMTIPGLGALHAERMRRHREIVTAAPLIATETPGRVTLRGGRASIEVPMGKPELARMRAGLRTTLDALLAGSESGDRPELVLLNARAGVEFRDMAEVDAFLRTLDRMAQLNIGSGHPQGGTAMSDDPHRGVVGADFRLRGVDNLWVCDASVFPGASGINPQWTIMALAHLCAQKVAEVL
jgi:choline dehydrogenase-like flavoprotein